MPLSPAQQQLVSAPLSAKIFLSGNAGTGKTTAAAERLRALLNAGVPGESVLILTPQRTLQEPYRQWLQSEERQAGGDPTLATIGGLARRMVQTFWSLAAEPAGFAHPHQDPGFLTLETAQYFMAHLVRPLLDEGYFESITINRNRLYSQILDNLNKAAIIGFPHTEIGARLDAAYTGEPAGRRIYADGQECANRFREYCLQNNLLDFSLQLEVFSNLLWQQDIVRNHLFQTYRHLIYDNVEEDGARAHDLLREWLPHFESALLLYDTGGGYRQFLGADPQTGWALADLCEERVHFSDSFVQTEPILCLQNQLLPAIQTHQPGAPLEESQAALTRRAFSILQARFYPELIETLAAETARLLQEGLPASQMVILAPYLSDALRFSLMRRLEERGVPVRSHRPSRSLREEPASAALLTLAMLAHPQWDFAPSRFDVAQSLLQAIQDMDLVRAQLLTEITYSPRDQRLSSFNEINREAQERITYRLGERYEALRAWLLAYRAEPEPLPLDHFLRRLFGEVLSQPGYGFHTNFDSVRVAASLIESVRKFRIALEPARLSFEALGKEYISMLSEGVLAAQYLQAWQPQNAEAVLVAPAHTFLLMNRPAEVQFWLDAGSSGWHERLTQPVTHPYVLSRGWQPGRLWTDADEAETNRENLAQLAAGLLQRCSGQVYLCLPELGEAGYEQRGDLVRAFQQVLQNTAEGR